MIKNFHPKGRTPGGLSNLASGLQGFRNLSDFRAAAPLPKDAEELFDDAVINVGLDRLTIVQDVLAANLTRPLDNWIGVPELYWEKVSRTGSAQRTMNPKTRGEDQIPDREGVTLPIYATLDDFSIGMRELEASRRAGVPLDTTQIEQATRRVNEAIEDAIINGGPTIGGNSSPGLLNAPNVNTQTYVDSEAWDAAGHTGDDITADVKGMADKLRADAFYGPYTLYVPTNYWNVLQDLYTDGTTTQDFTVLERLQRLQYGGAPLRVVEADLLPDDRTILVEMSRNVLDIVVGDEPTLISWQDGPGWNFNHVVMACMVPRVHDTYENQSGICTGNTS